MFFDKKRWEETTTFQNPLALVNIGFCVFFLLLLNFKIVRKKLDFFSPSIAAYYMFLPEIQLGQNLKHPDKICQRLFFLFVLANKLFLYNLFNFTLPFLNGTVEKTGCNSRMSTTLGTNYKHYKKYHFYLHRAALEIQSLVRWSVAWLVGGSVDLRAL